jgi:hypothetical protein
MGVKMNKEEIMFNMDLLRKELERINEEEKKEKNLKLVGKYFKKDNDYYKIIGLDENFEMNILVFSTENGLYNRELDLFVSNGYDWLPEDVVEIDHDEFYGRWLQFTTKLNMLSV